jgi:hypothetical protein
MGKEPLVPLGWEAMNPRDGLDAVAKRKYLLGIELLSPIP